MPDLLEPDLAHAAAAPTRRPRLQPGHCAIVGLQWGDEGKGKVTDVFAAADEHVQGDGFDFVVRYNGGANAGHSLEVGDQRYALHLIPSGILDPAKTNVLANGVVIDPIQLAREISELRERGLMVGDNLRISERAHVVMPYHKLQDRLLEAAIARLDGHDPIGTTGRGIGPCYADKALRCTAVRVTDLLDEATLREKLARIVAIKGPQLEGLARMAGEDVQPLDAGVLLDEIRPSIELLRPHVCDTAALLHGAMGDGKRLLFEGANATLLDIDHGTYPFVTSSNCSSLGVHTGAGIPGRLVPNVVGIVKAYSTRVGGGPFPTELHDATAHRIREVGREYGTTTGRPRRVGWLDLAALRYTARVSGATTLCLMLLDVLAGIEELKICTGYRLDGEVSTGFPADADALERVQPVYETLPGFESDIARCRRFDNLPPAARDYVRRIEEVVGVEAVMVSVGPRRDQTIVR